MPVPFNDLKAQLAPLEAELRAGFERVLGRGWFLAGPEVAAFEAEFAAWLGLPQAVALNSGTDALSLGLRALGLGPGDEVVLPALTAPPCWHAVLAAGCVPVFADVDPAACLLDPAAVDAAIGPRTRAVMAVHLYGLACDLDALAALCRERSLLLVEDCAQAHGATYRGKKAGTLGDLAAFSFYPTKNLGALGDAGAVACADPAVAQRLAMLRQYGERIRYSGEMPGANSRMDELQAAFLRARLARLDEDIAERRSLAAAYAAGLAGRSDWRLPTADELITLLAPARRGADFCLAPRFDPAQDRLWSADRATYTSAWFAHAGLGCLDRMDLTCLAHVRAVAG